MKVLTFATQKGGSGKSTLAASLAVAAQEDGEKVFCLELDRQGTLAKWFERREAEAPGFDRVGDSVALENALSVLDAEGFTLTVIDTPGTDSPAVTAAMRLSDLCLVPSQPTPPDLEATQVTVEALQDLGRRFMFVLNRAPSAKTMRLIGAIAGLRGAGILAEPVMVNRNDHQDAIGLGLGVTEFKPDSKAAEEIRQLWQSAKSKLQQEKRTVKHGKTA